MQKNVGISHFPHFTHFWFQKCGRYFCCIPTLIIDFRPFSTNKDLKYFSTLTRPKTFWKVCKCGNRLLFLYINTYSQFGFPHFTRFWNVKCVLCGFLTPVSTLLPLNFVKSTKKIFANVILCGFLKIFPHFWFVKSVAILWFRHIVALICILMSQCCNFATI